jgi:DNA helicase HerA-like ATPase
VKKEIRVSPIDRFRHFYIIGQTGTGKSTALLTMAQQDVPLGN